MKTLRQSAHSGLLALLLVTAAFGAPPQDLPAGPTPTAKAIEVAPFQFNPALPKVTIGTVNGKPVTADKLLIRVLEQNFNQGVNNLVMGKILDLELETAEDIELTDQDIEEELKAMLERSSPGMTIEQVQADGKTSLKHLRTTARTTRGWKMLFWAAQNIPEDQRHVEQNQFLMRFFMQQKMQGYSRKLRGTADAPDPQFVAQVTHNESKRTVSVDANEALDFLIGLVKHSALLDLQDQVLQQVALEHAMAQAGVNVAASEVAAWEQQKRAEHQPPFTWDQICNLKGTTPEAERDKWMKIQAWKRITDTEPSEEEILAFLEENKGFFLGHTKKVSHILVRTADEVTGMSLGDSVETDAKRKIELLHQKAVEGLEFSWLAKTYSDDAVTARGDGRLATPIKQWGSGLDPAFHEAAWKLEKIGDLSQPVRSQFGWHIIKLDEYNRPARDGIDWKNARYWAWIKEEYEAHRMRDYMNDLLEGIEIVPAPPEVVLGLKNRVYR